MNPSHVLVLKPGSLGDIVHTLPAVAAFRVRHPQARLTWMVNSEWAPLLEGHPHLDGTIIFPRAEFRGLAGWLRFLRWRSGLRHRIQPDLVLDFQGLLRSGLIARAFPGAEIYGLSDAREGSRFCQTVTVPVGRDMHAVERYLALAAAGGATTSGPLSFDLPDGTAPDASLPSTPFVLFHPFSRGEGKSLSTPAMAAFCQAARCPVVVAGRTDAVLPDLPANTWNLLNRTSLPELIWLLRRAAFTVSVDSGPMHLAAALTDRLLGLHTWSDPCRVGPYCPGAHVWRGRKFFPALDSASSSAAAVVPDAAEAAEIGRWVAKQMFASPA
ncbi:MAG: glycosyltransferase family 9 protein [Chthoniobacterales bacterium]|jgi:ADP-heptose:LPS heptosyltransferase